MTCHKGLGSLTLNVSYWFWVIQDPRIIKYWDVVLLRKSKPKSSLPLAANGSVVLLCWWGCQAGLSFHDIKWRRTKKCLVMPPKFSQKTHWIQLMGHTREQAQNVACRPSSSLLRPASEIFLLTAGLWPGCLRPLSHTRQPGPNVTVFGKQLWEAISSWGQNPLRGAQHSHKGQVTDESSLVPPHGRK